jgi:hypothetical protein
VSIFKIVNCWDLPPAIASMERVTIKYLTKINKKYQSFCFRKDALSNVDLIITLVIDSRIQPAQNRFYLP